MNIKNVIFFATIICCNASMLQAKDQKQITDSEQVIIDSCNKRLAALSAEEETQYLHTNICWGGAATGTALIIASCFDSNQNRSGNELKGGIALLITSTAIGVGSVFNENYKADHRRTERSKLIDQLSKLSHNR